MASAVQIPPPGFDELDVAGKIDYVHTLRDRIASDSDAVRLRPSQEEILLERLGRHRESPDEAKPWRQAVAEIEERSEAQ